MDTIAFNLARVASCWFMTARDSTMTKAETVTSSMTIPAITVRDRMRLKPGLRLLSFMPYHQVGGMSIITHCLSQARATFRLSPARSREGDKVTLDN